MVWVMPHINLCQANYMLEFFILISVISVRFCDRSWSCTARTLG